MIPTTMPTDCCCLSIRSVRIFRISASVGAAERLSAWAAVPSVMATIQFRKKVRMMRR